MTKKETYWAKVFFREYIAHYARLDEESILKDVRESIVSLASLDDSGENFGSKMVKWAKQRVEESYSSNQENGKKGGRPRLTMTKEMVIDFARKEKLDVNDAVECYYATVERNGKDAEGKPIVNCYGYIKSWCETRKNNREKGN